MGKKSEANARVQSLVGDGFQVELNPGHLNRSSQFSATGYGEAMHVSIAVKALELGVLTECHEY